MSRSIYRKRGIYLLWLLLVFTLGMLSRGAWVPDFLYGYLGDALYAMLIYIGLAFLFPSWASLRVGFTALAFCYIIEFSQLYHAPWIDAIRSYKVGGLILGYGFLWSDLASYFVGITIAVTLEKVFLKPNQS